MLEAGGSPGLFRIPPPPPPPPPLGLLLQRGVRSRAAPQTSPRRGRGTGPPGQRARPQLRARPGPRPLSSSPSVPVLRPGMPPNLTGYYRFVSQENMDDYLRALGNSGLLAPLLPPLFATLRLQKCPTSGKGLSVCDRHFCAAVGGGCRGRGSPAKRVEELCGDAAGEGTQVVQSSPPPSPPPDINVVLRKLVCLLKPDKEIIHTGDHMVIRTITSLRDYVMDFDLGVQFEEDLGPVDGRKCQVRSPSSAVRQRTGVHEKFGDLLSF